MVVERRVLFGIEYFEQGRGRSAAKTHAHLIDLVEQEERIRRLGLAHRLDNLAQHRTDVGPPMTANLRFVADAAERHANELAARRFRNGLAERGLADTWRTDEAQDRPGQLVSALLHGEILDDTLLDFVQAEMIGVQNRLRSRKILLDLRPLLPRNRQQPIKIVAYDRSFSRHRRHLPEFLDLGERLLSRFLRESRRLDTLLELRHSIRAVLVAKLLLDRLHLFVEIIFPLSLLHLPLDSRPDALLNLEHRNLALHRRETLLEALCNGAHLKDRLLVG